MTDIAKILYNKEKWTTLQVINVSRIHEYTKYCKKRGMSENSV